LFDLSSPKQFRRSTSAPAGRRTGRNELRLHRASEPITLQWQSRDCFVRLPKLKQGEFISKQPVGIRAVDVAVSDVFYGPGNDGGVVVREPPRRLGRNESGHQGEARRQLVWVDHLDMCDGKHPTAIITVRIV
jgi:hypothetical protein